MINTNVLLLAFTFDFKIITRKAPNTTIADFANTEDADDMSRLISIYSVCPLVFDFFNKMQFILGRNLVVCFFWRFTG